MVEIIHNFLMVTLLFIHAINYLDAKCDPKDGFPYVTPLFLELLSKALKLYNWINQLSVSFAEHDTKSTILFARNPWDAVLKLNIICATIVFKDLFHHSILIFDQHIYTLIKDIIHRVND